MYKFFLTLMLVMLLGGCFLPNSDNTAHVVSKGDTLYNVSKRYDVPLRELIEHNNLRPPYTLKIGQVLRIPVSSYHIVAKGDTMYNVSKRYGMKVNELAKINDIQPPYPLMIGQKLALSGSLGSTSAPAKRPTVYAKKSSAPSRPVSTSRKTKFQWPVRGKVISKYGAIGKGRANDGINIQAARGTPVVAADAGTIAYAGNELKGFGNLVLIKHSDGWISAYAHNDRLLVKKGVAVRRGEKIATIGTTGGVNSPQLHFEIRAGKKAVNPVQYLP